MKITTIGLDVAKRVFQVHGVDAHGKVGIRKQLRRKEMMAYFTNLPACTIGMEAGSSSHNWARRLQGLGHTVKLMAPQFVRPYVKTNKNDARDAEAICEAVTRPSMRFVLIKTASNRRCWRCLGRGKALSKHVWRRRINYAVCLPHVGS